MKYTQVYSLARPLEYSVFVLRNATVIISFNFPHIKCLLYTKIISTMGRNETLDFCVHRVTSSSDSFQIWTATKKREKK